MPYGTQEGKRLPLDNCFVNLVSILISSCSSESSSHLNSVFRRTLFCCTHHESCENHWDARTFLYAYTTVKYFYCLSSTMAVLQCMLRTEGQCRNYTCSNIIVPRQILSKDYSIYCVFVSVLASARAAYFKQ